MPKTRPYLVRIQGETRIVEGTSREAAIGHCTKPMVEECRPAKPNEIVGFVRGGGEVEIAGVYPEPEKELSLPGANGIQTGDAVLLLAEGVDGQAGAKLVKDGDFYRLATDGDEPDEIVVVPEGARLDGNVLTWTPAAAHKAPDAAVAHDGHNVQTADGHAGEER